MPTYFISFDCTGGMAFEADDRDQAEFEMLNYLRDSFPDFSNFDVTDVKEI